jgi:hypothetical protein
MGAAIALAELGGISTLTLIAFVPETLPPLRHQDKAPSANGMSVLEFNAADLAGVEGDLLHDD